MSKDANRNPPSDWQNALAGSKFAVFFLGLFGMMALVNTVVLDTRLFTDPRFDGLWSDVETYHFNADARPSLDELRQKYGHDVVANYFDKPILRAAYLPNENVALLNVMIYHREESTLERTMGYAFLIAFCYLPVAFGFRLAQEWTSTYLCLTRSARQAREEYFGTLHCGRLRSTLLVFTVTVAIAFFHAATRTTDRNSATHLPFLDVVVCLVFLAYVGGLYARLVSYVVDTALLILGINPHRALWDEVITLAIVAPVLWLVYKNSWWTVVSSAVAGLGAGFISKWRHGRRNRWPDTIQNASPKPT